jgi:hypothetical protein
MGAAPAAGLECDPRRQAGKLNIAVDLDDDSWNCTGWDRGEDRVLDGETNRPGGHGDMEVTWSRTVRRHPPRPRRKQRRPLRHRPVLPLERSPFSEPSAAKSDRDGHGLASNREAARSHGLRSQTAGAQPHPPASSWQTASA